MEKDSSTFIITCADVRNLNSENSDKMRENRRAGDLRDGQIQSLPPGGRVETKERRVYKPIMRK